MIRSLLLFVLLVALAAVGVVEHRAPGTLARYSGPDGSVLQVLPPPFAGQQLLRFVLIGADDREDRGRSDTLMVLSLNPQWPRAALLSIPRDLRVDIPGHGVTKVNHAYRFGGAPLTRRTVEELLGEPTAGYLTINFQGFVKAIDALGGVVLEVEDCEGQGRGMNYDCPQDGLVIHMKPGRQRLNGYKAMGYVRYRKSNIPGAGCTDFERAARQQKLLRALIAQKVKPGHFRQLWQAGQEVWRCVRSTLTARQAVDLVRCLKAMGPGDLKTMTVPAVDEKIGGVYYAGVDREKFPQVQADIATHLAGRQVPIVTPRVEVLNASGKKGLAAAAAARLKAAGFEVTNVGNAPSSGQQRTVVLYRTDSKPLAQQAVQVLSCGGLEYDDSGPTPPGQPHIQVRVGKDFGG
jgi:polyisoprenyl-teichoic acid--peptidoglycan teichoic acid transferase